MLDDARGKKEEEGARSAATRLKVEGRGHCPPTLHPFPFPSRDNIDKRYLSANLPDELSTSFLRAPLHPRGNLQFLSFVAVFTLAKERV